MSVDRVDDAPMVEHNALTQKIKQKSKVDYVEVGNNWKTFYWPSRLPVHASMPVLHRVAFFQ